MFYSLDSRKFYSSSPQSFLIERAVSKAGGEIAHLSLFNFLLTKSFRSELELLDMRSGNSLLFIFPPFLQLILSIVLTSEEAFIERDFRANPNFNSEYKLDSFTYTPLDVLLIHAQITGHKVSTLYSSLLGSFSYERLDFLFKLPTSLDIFDTSIPLYKRLETLITHYGFSNSSFVDIASSGDRIRAGIEICNRLGYSEVGTSEIIGLIESWLLNSI